MTSGGTHPAATNGHDEATRNRVVVADSRAARDGRFLEIIGHYDPLTNPPTIKIETEKASAWIKKGAQPSNTVRVLLSRVLPKT